MIGEREPDVLLLDLRMPGMSGVETLHALKSAGRSVRMIILTNYETDEDIYRAVQAGAQGYLLKGHLVARDAGRDSHRSRGQTLHPAAYRVALGGAHGAD